MIGEEKNKYRQTKDWKDFRKRILEDRNYTCEICNTKKKKGLHIHHINESKYGNETDEDVVILCPTCHKLVEWMLSRTKNTINLNDFCKNLKWVYYTTREKSYGHSKNKEEN